MKHADQCPARPSGEDLSDAYRKEIDQEENVWRSLPFLAATLALQLAALAQAHDWLTAVSGTTFVVATALLTCAGLATLAALVFLALSVWPADFRYVGSELSFLAYAEEVRGQAGVAGEGEADAAALKTVKAALAQQYALATDNNRWINQRRSRWRTRVGLTTLMSVLAVLVLLGLDVIKVTHGHQGKHPVVSASGDASVAGIARSKGVQSGGATADDGRAQGWLRDRITERSAAELAEETVNETAKGSGQPTPKPAEPIKPASGEKIEPPPTQTFPQERPAAMVS